MQSTEPKVTLVPTICLLYSGCEETAVALVQNYSQLYEFISILRLNCDCIKLISVRDVLEAKLKYRGMFETQKVRRHDKFRKEWSQHKNKCKSQMGQDQVSGGGTYGNVVGPR